MHDVKGTWVKQAEEEDSEVDDHDDSPAVVR